MKLFALYHSNSEFTTPLEAYGREFHQRFNRNIELISVDSKEGAALASLYDTYDYPSFIVTKDDGTLSKCWQGSTFPTLDEIYGYFAV